MNIIIIGNIIGNTWQAPNGREMIINSWEKIFFLASSNKMAKITTKIEPRADI